MNSVTVFCGAAPGRDRTHLQAATLLGREIAEAGLRLVYGGAVLGLMGAVADGALEAGGSVVGVIPENFPREIAHQGLTELHLVPDMHRRKALMGELGDAFVTLPGGLGTAEEFFEVLTWAQIRLHSKPCLLLNHGGYYGPLLTYLSHAAQEGFVDAADIERLVVCRDPAEVLRHLTALRQPVAR